MDRNLQHMPNFLRTSSYPKAKRFQHRRDLNLEALGFRKLGEVLPAMALGPRRTPWLIEKNERSYSVAGIDKAILCRTKRRTYPFTYERLSKA